MKDFFNHFLSDDNWLIKQREWEKHKQGAIESKFTLGNGYLGSRGILEEMPYDAHAGTYIAGVYDRIGSMVTELVNRCSYFVIDTGNICARIGIVG